MVDAVLEMLWRKRAGIRVSWISLDLACKINFEPENLKKKRRKIEKKTPKAIFNLKYAIKK